MSWGSGYEGHDGEIMGCSKWNHVYLYKVGCGYEEKEFIRESDNANNLADNEQIIAVTITY